MQGRLEAQQEHLSRLRAQVARLFASADDAGRLQRERVSAAEVTHPEDCAALREKVERTCAYANTELRRMREMYGVPPALAPFGRLVWTEELADAQPATPMVTPQATGADAPRARSGVAPAVWRRPDEPRPGPWLPPSR